MRKGERLGRRKRRRRRKKGRQGKEHSLGRLQEEGRRRIGIGQGWREGGREGEKEGEKEGERGRSAYWKG